MIEGLHFTNAIYNSVCFSEMNAKKQDIFVGQPLFNKGTCPKTCPPSEKILISQYFLAFLQGSNPPLATKKTPELFRSFSFSVSALFFANKIQSKYRKNRCTVIKYIVIQFKIND